VIDSAVVLLDCMLSWRWVSRLFTQFRLTPPLSYLELSRCTVPSTARRTWPTSVVHRCYDDDILGSYLILSYKRGSVSFLPLFGWMIEKSELDPKSFLSDAGSLADHAKCFGFVILLLEHVIFRYKASQPVDLCIFSYRLRQQNKAAACHIAFRLYSRTFERRYTPVLEGLSKSQDSSFSTAS